MCMGPNFGAGFNSINMMLIIVYKTNSVNSSVKTH